MHRGLPRSSFLVLQTSEFSRLQTLNNEQSEDSEAVSAQIITDREKRSICMCAPTYYISPRHSNAYFHAFLSLLHSLFGSFKFSFFVVQTLNRSTLF